jgi:5-methylcytosine-specific restriction endonuclease McrA
MREYMRVRDGYYSKVVCSDTGCRRKPWRDGRCRGHAPRLISPPRILSEEERVTARRELDRRYREKHREQRRARQKEYAKANPNKINAGSQAARARKRQAFVEPIDPHVVFERDGWRCGLCKRSIPKLARHPDPKSASLDHIVPLSQGGKHEYRNVQAAHLYCNQTKQGRVWRDGEQLRLVG